MHRPQLLELAFLIGEMVTVNSAYGFQEYATHIFTLALLGFGTLSGLPRCVVNLLPNLLVLEGKSHEIGLSCVEIVYVFPRVVAAPSTLYLGGTRVVVPEDLEFDSFD